MPAGAPTRYDPALHPKLTKYMARLGMTNEGIAQELGITKTTFQNWLKRYSELFDSLKAGRDFHDGDVEDALLKRALGYEYTETEAYETPKGGVRRKIIKKQMPPDVTAQIFWLKNRQRSRWRDVQRVEQKNLQAGENFSDLTDDEIERELRAELVRRDRKNPNEIALGGEGTASVSE